MENKQIKISQTIIYHNNTNNELDLIYLNDWNNSYSSKNTPLAQRLAEEYKDEFQLVKDEDRGFSDINYIKQNGQLLEYEILKDQQDVIKVYLKEALKPNASYELELDYIVKIPHASFTRYGINDYGNISLRYWYITPTVYDGQWQYYSNKNLDDLFIPKADVTLEIEYPNTYDLTSDLNLDKLTKTSENEIIALKGKHRNSNKLFLQKDSDFDTIQADDLSIISNIDGKGVEIIDQVIITERIAKFITENFGEYPHERLLLTQIDYDKDPIYGLNFLPKFIKTHPLSFEYELKILKIALYNYLENTLLLNPRKEQWLIDGIQIYYMMQYVDKYYPDMKFLGSISDFWAARPFHASDMMYNDKYILAYMIMARTNRDQPLTMAKDSLLKYNKNIANKYKAGVGLQYLDDFTDHTMVESSIESFVKESKLKNTSITEFENYLKSQTDKNIDWFFSDYLATRKVIDYKIKKVSKTEDSITLTIKNKGKNNMPVSLYTLKNDSVVAKQWVEDIPEYKTITIPRNEGDKLVLNYENSIPEFNLRDNWKSLKGAFSNNKPLQVRLFKDLEDPNYSQVFIMPILEFNNIYDGINLGLKAYNKTILRRMFYYKIAPQYSFGSNAVTGSLTVSKTHNIQDRNLFYLNYGFSGSYKSYAEDLFVRRLTPSFSLLYRDNEDFRSNKRGALYTRFIDIHRDEDERNLVTSDEPNYSLFNTRFVYSNDNLINFYKWYVDLQFSKEFSKVSLNYEYRHLFENNRQINVRAFAGTFLRNDNDPTSDYFSFALNRPTDYLFDYNYLGRSETTGIFSQQYIPAEGGFKSKLEPAFANQWITTLNASTTLWRYILLYGDVGLVKNRYEDPKFVYGTGVRVNLVTDYFELYFPIYSNLGWEVSQPNYAEHIRFIFTIDPQSLLGLFRRRWF
ncbi:metalloprotease [Tamlana sp. 2_MG-2023]|uniref:metalloprotease n=1 Tax=unclassified Tamlana TaxID=2614803 RepID=UPI0026E1CDC8|nr:MULTISPECIES: metalloprotease [unclassified Tamlana]MDO6759598.1 metalloprotease [Tamlana sp. 2_MG-2023]MDO6792175.1 metalloprotease [Tamlana sp. 1_MG-2023]